MGAEHDTEHDEQGRSMPAASYWWQSPDADGLARVLRTPVTLDIKIQEFLIHAGLDPGLRWFTFPTHACRGGDRGDHLQGEASRTLVQVEARERYYRRHAQPASKWNDHNIYTMLHDVIRAG